MAAYLVAANFPDRGALLAHYGVDEEAIERWKAKGLSIAETNVSRELVDDFLQRAFHRDGARHTRGGYVLGERTGQVISGTMHELGLSVDEARRVLRRCGCESDYKSDKFLLNRLSRPHAKTRPDGGKRLSKEVDAKVVRMLGENSPWDGTLTVRPTIESILCWENDDDGYERWVTSNPEGFVANMRGSSYVMVHHAKHRLPDRSSPRTENPRTGARYKKAGCADLRALCIWVQVQGCSLERTAFCKNCWSESNPALKDVGTVADLTVVQRQTDELLRQPVLHRPAGNPVPAPVESGVVRSIPRSPGVRAWAIRRSRGTCELCMATAPFLNDSGRPFLEVHHMHQLAHGGPDTPENVAAVCPNCHRHLHYGVGRDELTAELMGRVRAKDEGTSKLD